MTLSHNWLSEYIPTDIEPQALGNILTSIGLEVENMESQERSKASLGGLLVGEVMTCEKHPKADKLKLTTVSTGTGSLLNIVCGASNVAVGQKVVVAPAGVVIHPVNDKPLLISKTSIRGVESEGMICAEDEIGIGTHHEGILVLPPETPVGIDFSEFYVPGKDHIFEIGLTPNRMDAMSHLGVAKDVCAYLSHHDHASILPLLPYPVNFTSDETSDPFSIQIEDTEACRRYSAVLIRDITVTDSPLWLQHRLKSINIKPINNIVDITNFILHETGQPLHAFDADKIDGKKIVVKTLPEGSPFTTLDGKIRKLSSNDLMICSATQPLCIGGVYGGIESGVTLQTKNILLESAWFRPSSIRRTSLLHGLRTDAASRFEKGTDISNTVNVLKRAAQLAREAAGGKVGEIIDIYPNPLVKKKVELTYEYLEKLSGKSYPPEGVKNILTSLGFEIIGENKNSLSLLAPFSKPDISLPCDIVEEVMRIDGLDNVVIPPFIKLAPAIEKNNRAFNQKEKVADHLAANGFYEIFTNSITNEEYYDENLLAGTVKMISSLNTELTILRPSMLESGLQAIAHNCNRKINDLRFFEFGKTYSKKDAGKYIETDHLSLYMSGKNPNGWKNKPANVDFFDLKGFTESILLSLGIRGVEFKPVSDKTLIHSASITVQGRIVGTLGSVNTGQLKKFDIRQPVFYADIIWNELIENTPNKVEYQEVSRFPAMERDLALVVDKSVTYSSVTDITSTLHLTQLNSIHLFDIFESEKLGAGKKSMALHYIFQDKNKTLTDEEVDEMMHRLMKVYQTTLSAEIRK